MPTRRALGASRASQIKRSGGSCEVNDEEVTAVRHEISNEGGLALVEEHDIVYRDRGQRLENTPTLQSAPQNGAWTQEVLADAVMLFRHSALTLNPHRIHEIIWNDSVTPAAPHILRYRDEEDDSGFWRRIFGCCMGHR